MEKWIYHGEIVISMSRVRVRYFGMLKEIVGKRDEEGEVNDATRVNELIKFLAEKNGEKFSHNVFDNRGRVRDGLAIAVDGDTVDSERLQELKCKNVNEFVIIPPISGG